MPIKRTTPHHRPFDTVPVPSALYPVLVVHLLPLHLHLSAELGVLSAACQSPHAVVAAAGAAAVGLPAAGEPPQGRFEATE